MNALGFLLRKKMINFVRDILHHPSRLVLYIVVIGVILLSALSGGTEEIETCLLYTSYYNGRKQREARPRGGAKP